MPQHSRVFRLIAALTGFLILAGAGLPAGIHAGHDMSIYCEMPGDTTPATHDHAAMTHDAEDQSHPEFPQQQNRDGNSSCHLTMICCGTEQAVAVQSVSKTGTIHLVTTRQVGDYFMKPVSLRSVSLEQAVLEASPPLFLTNNSFLN